MEVTSERASQDLSDAEHLVLISSLLRKWWQIEILKIWLWLQIFVGFWPITLEPLITVQKWKIPSEENIWSWIFIGLELLVTRSITRRTFGLDIFIIKEMVTDWNFENLTLASDFCRFLADNFGTAHHSAKMEIPSERASQDLSDADNLLLHYYRWRLIEFWQFENHVNNGESHDAS